MRRVCADDSLLAILAPNFVIQRQAISFRPQNSGGGVATVCHELMNARVICWQIDFA